MMMKRHISKIAFSRDFGRQMRFIIGPRQTGKTTAAKEFLKKQNCLKLYYNWDDRKTRDRYIADYHFFVRELYNVKPSNGLAGRYFTFRLNPVTLRELTGKSFLEPPADADDWIMQKLDHPTYKEKELSALSKIASPLSINSLTANIKCSFATVSNYLKAMELGYLIFRVLPYSKKIARSLTKEKKVYFFDWTRINDPAAQFENYMAVELKTLLELWTDAGIGNFDLHFIRDRDGRETDFLILREKEPWLMLEAKLSRSTIDYHHRKNRNILGGIPFIQVVRQENVAEKREGGLYQMSASRFFA
jgi:predicted AAA+ superfamily ATPase